MRGCRVAAVSLTLVAAAGCSHTPKTVVEARAGPSASPSTTTVPRAATTTSTATVAKNSATGTGQGLSLQPAVGLHTGQVLHVVATGYMPHESFVVTECADKGNNTAAADCNLPGIKTVNSDATGTVIVDFVVVIGPFGQNRIICGGTQPCVVAVSQPSYQSTETASATITFGAAPTR